MLFVQCNLFPDLRSNIHSIIYFLSHQEQSFSLAGFFPQDPDIVFLFGQWIVQEMCAFVLDSSQGMIQESR